MVQKQEGEEAETMEQCIKRTMAANEEMTEEQARQACTKEEKSKTPPNLTEQIIAVMTEYGKTLSENVKKDIMEKMDNVVKETKDEAVEAIRKGLGLNKDPVIHLSQVEDLVRKIVLENTDHGKRTETPTPEKPAEGSDVAKGGKMKSADDMYKEAMQKRGAP